MLYSLLDQYSCLFPIEKKNIKNVVVVQTMFHSSRMKLKRILAKASLVEAQGEEEKEN